MVVGGGGGGVCKLILVFSFVPKLNNAMIQHVTQVLGNLDNVIQCIKI